LLERSSVLSFVSLPISAGIGPVMLLFCMLLQQGKGKQKINMAPVKKEPH
jgi:hypothetical protein